MNCPPQGSALFLNGTVLTGKYGMVLSYHRYFYGPIAILIPSRYHRPDPVPSSLRTTIIFPMPFYPSSMPPSILWSRPIFIRISCHYFHDTVPSESPTRRYVPGRIPSSSRPLRPTSLSPISARVPSNPPHTAQLLNRPTVPHLG